MYFERNEGELGAQNQLPRRAATNEDVFLWLGISVAAVVRPYPSGFPLCGGIPV